MGSVLKEKTDSIEKGFVVEKAFQWWKPSDEAEFEDGHMGGKACCPSECVVVGTL